MGAKEIKLFINEDNLGSADPMLALRHQITKLSIQLPNLKLILRKRKNDLDDLLDPDYIDDPVERPSRREVRRQMKEVINAAEAITEALQQMAEIYIKFKADREAQETKNKMDELSADISKSLEHAQDYLEARQYDSESVSQAPPRKDQGGSPTLKQTQHSAAEHGAVYKAGKKKVQYENENQGN